MISLTEVTLKYPGMPPVLDRVSARFESGQRIGILALPGSGKSSLAKLLSGAIEPSGGEVSRQGKVSWPLGFAGVFHPELTGFANLELLAQMTGEDLDAMLEWSIGFGGLESALSKNLKMFSPQERAMLGYCCSLSVPCDWYIADETLTVGGKAWLEQCESALSARLEGCGLVFISKNAHHLKKHCQRIIALVDGHLVECPNVDVAEQVLAQWPKQGNS
ncbi:ATP-binding cassette domain-containing protein [Ferrimonas balearica]|uniref:ATP-binding cassette domain-containing protein n=1 Tax=Ferrimonas balearica TaxID=44012 RepID=UPI001C95F026|nr:ATP-binding cassette domain-containing protein [Ferrimonas balearica]MBY5981235.1 ATP-binding cassette domain-containing protein [Ferrimonas balearica]